MESTSIPQEGLTWERRPFAVAGVKPTWTRDPEIEAIKATVLEHLPQSNGEYISITFLEEGSFNKVYRIEDTRDRELYIMRISLPVDPFHKTSAEVATLLYLNENTDMPVPKVIAYDACSSNGIGFEWILMSFLPGVSLATYYLGLPVEQKQKIVKQMVYYMAQMYRLQFNDMGGLRKTGDGYSVGRMVNQVFWWYKRVHASTSKGPFKTLHDWLSTQSQLMLNEAEDLLAEEKENYPDLESDYEILVANASRIRASIPALLERTVPPTSDASGNLLTALTHADLGEHNILIDPITCEITGIIDWENVSTQPLALACQIPLLLDPTALPREQAPDIDEHADASDNEDDETKERQLGKCKAYGRKLLEHQHVGLRDYFLEEMEKICPQWIQEYYKGEELRDITELVECADMLLCQRYINTWFALREEGRQGTITWIRNCQRDYDEHPELYEDENEGDEADIEAIMAELSDDDEDEEGAWTPAMFPNLVGAIESL